MGIFGFTAGVKTDWRLDYERLSGSSHKTSFSTSRTRSAAEEVVNSVSIKFTGSGIALVGAFLTEFAVRKVTLPAELHYRLEAVLLKKKTVFLTIQRVDVLNARLQMYYRRRVQ